MKKGAKELIKRGSPVVKDLIKKGKDAFSRDGKATSKGRNQPRTGKTQNPAVTAPQTSAPGQSCLCQADQVKHQQHPHQ